jgi:hypothetical protein
MSNKIDPRQIECLIAIDANTLSKEIQPGTAERPVQLTKAQADKYIVMMAPPEFMRVKQYDSNLQLAAVTDDQIRWRCSPFAPLRAGALLTKFNFVKGASLLSKPHLVPVEKYTLVQLHEDEPMRFEAQLYTDSRWEATCKTAGEAWYNFTFATVEPGSQQGTKVLGYYFWDPAISISFG